MKIIKKMKVCVALAMLAALVFSTTINAESSYTQKVKSSNDTSYYHPNNKEDRIYAFRECDVDTVGIDKLYSVDSPLWKYAHMFDNQYEYTLYDLKKMADILNEGIEARYGYFFNQGFMATDDLTNPSHKVFVCRCSQNDFDQFVKKCVDNSWTHTYVEKTHRTTYSKTFPGSITYEIDYDANEKVLIAENFFLN